MNKERDEERPEQETEALQVTQHPEESEPAALSRAALTPHIQGAMTARAFMPEYFAQAGANLNGLAQALDEQSKQINKGDFSHAESVLATQAATLDMIFHRLAVTSNNCKYMDKMERYLKLALKAQGQCRTTLEALSEIKAPKAVSFVRQANFAGGHQQVNNYGESNSDESSQGDKVQTRQPGKAKDDHALEQEERSSIDEELRSQSRDSCAVRAHEKNPKTADQTFEAKHNE